LEQNKDIIKLPSDVETLPLLWSDLNKPSQNWVRKYLITYAKEGLARIWGKFSGELQVPDSTVKLDYSSLLTEAKDEKSKLIEELMNRLERLRPEKILLRKKEEAENLNGSLKFRPIISPINVI
jgi:transcription initiation factor IIE alpha subunit